VYKIASSINILYLIEQAPRRLLNFSASNAAPIRGRRFFKNWTQQRKNAENRLLAQVTGKRKREVGLVVLAKFTAFHENYVSQEFWTENLMGERRGISRRSLHLPCIWATAYLHLWLFLE